VIPSHFEVHDTLALKPCSSLQQIFRSPSAQSAESSQLAVVLLPLQAPFAVHSRSLFPETQHSWRPTAQVSFPHWIVPGVATSVAVPEELALLLDELEAPELDVLEPAGGAGSSV
jgi:hypothetical protein